MKKKTSFLYISFLINKSFYNPFMVFLNRYFNINIKKTFNFLKMSLLLDKNQLFFLNFYFNFFQIPLLDIKTYGKKGQK